MRGGGGGGGRGVQVGRARWACGRAGAGQAWSVGRLPDAHTSLPCAWGEHDLIRNRSNIFLISCNFPSVPLCSIVLNTTLQMGEAIVPLPSLPAATEGELAVIDFRI